ncbi:hypothetical protein PG990_009094 [Apiospora arundinis]
MADIAIVQYTGEPRRRQTARIPRAMWEERKSQIIVLYQEYTLDDVVEKMAEVGFTANRRQYIYQLEQWGIAKYDVKCGKSPGPDDVFRGKRKHLPAGTAEDRDDHCEPLSPQATSSHKRPKVAKRWIIGPEDDLEEEHAAGDEREPEQERSAPTKTKATRAYNHFNPTLQPYSLPSFSATTTFSELCEVLRCSRFNWHGGQFNLEIAHQVSLLAQDIRPQLQEYIKDRYMSSDNQAYLQEIGGYLWGTKRGEGAFDIYALVLMSARHSINGGVNMTTVLLCVRSANNRETCQWVASFLQERKVALENFSDNWDALILSYLMLARKLVAHELQASAKTLARDALRLRVKAFSSQRYGPFASCVHSIQDLYFPEVATMCDLEAEATTIRTQTSRNLVAWNFSQLATDQDCIRSKLLSFGSIIMGHGLEAILPCEVKGEEDIASVPPFSDTLFELIWRVQFKSQQQRVWWTLTDTMSNSHGTSLPDFVGACCDLLAHLVIQHNKTAKAGTNDSHVDLVEIVSHMDKAQLYMDFVRAYCCRDWRCSIGELREPQRDGYYNLSPELIYWRANGRSPGYQAVPSKESRFYDNYIDTLLFPTKPAQPCPRLHSCQLPLPPPLPQSSRPLNTTPHFGKGSIDPSVDYFLSDVAMQILSPQCSVPRPRVENYYLDPTLGSPCRSSLASYGDMVEARAAMARNVKLVKGSGGSLPSTAMRLEEELSTSMRGLSVQET